MGKLKGWVNENQNYSRVGYLGNKNLLSFAKLKSNVNSHVSIQYVNLDHFPICQEANGVSKESTSADNMKL